MRSTVVLNSNTWKLGTSIEVTAMGLGTKRPSARVPPTPLFIIMTIIIIMTMTIMIIIIIRSQGGCIILWTCCPGQ